MTTSYNLSIATNFGGNFLSYQFQAEIAASSISATCLWIDTNGDTVTIYFSAALSSGDLTTLNNLATAHIPKPDGKANILLPFNTSVIKCTIGATQFTYLGNQFNEIHISTQVQAQYSTIGAAIAANNTPNNVFIVHPGTYVENNPLVLPT